MTFLNRMVKVVAPNDDDIPMEYMMTFRQNLMRRWMNGSLKVMDLAGLNIVGQVV